MINAIIENPLTMYPKPWWQPFLSFFIILYGILALGWSLQPIVFLFWWESFLMIGSMLIRVLFALNGKPFLDNLFKRVMMVVFGGILSIAIIMLVVTFSFKVFENGLQEEGFGEIPYQVRILTTGYLLGLVLHYFANGRYKTANPLGEQMGTMMHLLVLILLLMVLAMHLIPAYPQLDQAKWVGIAVISVKFAVDWFFTRSPKSVQTVFPES